MDCSNNKIKGIVYQTEEQAIEACNKIDKEMGLPNADTDRWTLPIRLIDGWLVQQPDGTGDFISKDRLYDMHMETEDDQWNLSNIIEKSDG